MKTQFGFLLLATTLWFFAAGQARADTSLSRTVAGTTIHLGIVPLKQAVQRAASSPEQVTHGLRKPGKSDQHLVVALSDARSGQRISDADVTVTVSELGFASQEKRLQPMTTGGAPSYGNTFSMKPGAQYVIKVSVWRPGVHTATEAKFDFTRP